MISFLAVLAGYVMQAGADPRIIGLAFEGIDMKDQNPTGMPVVVPLAVSLGGEWINGSKLQNSDALWETKKASLNPPLENGITPTSFYALSPDVSWSISAGPLAISNGIYNTLFTGFEGKESLKEVQIGNDPVPVSTKKPAKAKPAKEKPNDGVIIALAEGKFAKLESDSSAKSGEAQVDRERDVPTFADFVPALGERPAVAIVTPFVSSEGTPAAWIAVKKGYKGRDTVSGNSPSSSETKYTALYYAIVIQTNDTWIPVWEDFSLKAEDEWSPFLEWRILGTSDVNGNHQTEVVLEASGWEVWYFLAIELDIKSHTAPIVGSLEGTL